MRSRSWGLVCACLLAGCAETRTGSWFSSREGVVDREVKLPPVPREFRAAWVATVANIDWPSKRGLTTAEQQEEMLAILDRAKALRLNAIILQVRCVADALYASDLEPWASYLTGKQGVAPDPYYDPLEFAIEQAHNRGLELHAWFNPFRAGQEDPPSDAATHVAQKHPDWVCRYGTQLWLDPAIPEAREHSLAVIRDVVRRYDVDGVHVDDYFYPYPLNGEDGKRIDFPDEDSWKKYQAGGGQLSRGDWRRGNINGFMRAFYSAVREEKPHVKVGISPFGIWRPSHPEQVRGLDAYDSLYADARLWLQEGWLDYMVPQLYWRINSPEQSYPMLMHWWSEQNTKTRHIWIGNYINSVGESRRNWPVSEITNQVSLSRAEPGVEGNVFFSMKSLMRNRAGLSNVLAQLYAVPALVPSSPWLDDVPPPAPRIRIGDAVEGVLPLSVSASEGERPMWWVVHVRYDGVWRLHIMAATETTRKLMAECDGCRADLIAVQAVDRCGNLSDPAIIH